MHMCTLVAAVRKQYEGLLATRSTQRPKLPQGRIGNSLWSVKLLGMSKAPALKASSERTGMSKHPHSPVSDWSSPNPNPDPPALLPASQLVSLLSSSSPPNTTKDNDKSKPIGIPNSHLIEYESTVWSDNMCWLDCSLELLFLCYQCQKTLWRKLERIPFAGDIHNPAYIWNSLINYMDRKRFCYEALTDIGKELRMLRNQFARILFDAKLPWGTFGEPSSPWVGTNFNG